MIENFYYYDDIFTLVRKNHFKKILQLKVSMGGSTSIQYSVPIGEKGEDCTPIMRHPQFKDELLSTPDPKLTTMKDILREKFKKYPKSHCLGKIVRPKEEKEFIEYITYQEVMAEAQNIGSAILHEKLFHQPEGQNLRFVGIFSRNRPQWTILDVGCIFYNLVSIPIYDTLGDQNISYVFNHTNLTTCFVNDLGVRALMKTHDMGNVKTIVSFDPFKEEQQKYFAQKGIQLRSYRDLLKIGQANKIFHDQFKVQPSTCLTFSYTSGTTGPPKGAMISHSNFTSFLAALESNPHANFTEKDITLSYLPLPHILERLFVYGLLFCGGTIVFYSGDIQKLKDDLALVRPTIFLSVPRLYSRFYDALKGKFNQIQGYTKAALDYAVSTKLRNVETNGGFTHRVLDPLFFNKTKAALGGRVRLMISGSAPLLPDVHSFMKVAMCAPLMEGYGQTESTGAAFITHAKDPTVGHIGGPVSNVEFKLVDIPEMKYTSNDTDEEGRPMPRGELWMRGPGVFLGYYKNDEKTKETITEDGWLKSGDVGAILPHNKALKLIDRKKNIFKLQQGEYVAAEKVENAYMKCSIVAEVFLYGESTHTFALTIVTPHKEKILEIAKQQGIEAPYEELLQNNSIRIHVLEGMNKIAKEVGLKGFEMARNIHLEPVGFLARGILTNTMKLQRHEAKLSYADEIKGMYDQGMLPSGKQKKKE